MFQNISFRVPLNGRLKAEDVRVALVFQAIQIIDLVKGGSASVVCSRSEQTQRLLSRVRASRTAYLCQYGISVALLQKCLAAGKSRTPSCLAEPATHNRKRLIVLPPLNVPQAVVMQDKTVIPGMT